MRRKNPSTAFSTHLLMLVTPHSAEPDPDPGAGAGAVVPGAVVVGGAVVEGGVTHRRVVVGGGVVVGAGVAGAVVTGGVGVGVVGWAVAPPEPVSTIRTAASTAVVLAAARRAAGVNRVGAGGVWAEVVTVRLR
ncbi:hypothetical protein NN3_05360 [Nocardia neocaledoniensis NBRC 108232]|nr:hypothetical protein NN3_05360 [Nocardia neocaledoniensis NBRC 108232]